MKKILLIGFTMLLIAPLLAQEYTWERNQVSHTGGHQGNGDYTSFFTSAYYNSGVVIGSENSGYTGFLLPKLDIRLPRIDTIADVPNDQGQKVQVVWEQSGYDDGLLESCYYSIWREDELPGGVNSGFTSFSDPLSVVESAINEPAYDWYWFASDGVWTYLNQIPAIDQESYSYNAPTLHDSLGPDKLNHSTYKIVFHTSDEFYSSLPDSGYSIDNLAPFAPDMNSDFMIQEVLLTWDHNQAPDLQYYSIYRSETAGVFPPDPYATTVDTSYNDPQTTGNTLYYAVTATDYNGNESEFSNVTEMETMLRIDLNVYLEGPFLEDNMSTSLNQLAKIPLGQPYNVQPWNYSGEESVPSIPNPEVVDWVLLDLRDADGASVAGSSTTISLQAAFLLSNGSVVGLDGVSIPAFNAAVNQNLFVVVWHRNHLGIISSEPLEITNGTLFYDYSTGADKVLGGTNGFGQLASGIWGMLSGDANGDGMVNSGDKISAWSTAVGSLGYFNSDFDLNGQVTNQDKNDLWLINFGKESQVPE